eukprot:TRINITY_DN18002_c0_g1_i2.p1 TRINITY_DN18002_c0_g1~~TRINITY_DN18002_c0_g1_i2.p1  ORF type:complete len:159 (+),score=37.29 TRINITY_DN18002_c0_g1_i2:109-585(+)
MCIRDRPDAARAVPFGQIVDTARARGQPVVVFPELVRTNGTALLQMESTWGALLQSHELLGIAFCHTKTRHSLPFPAGNALTHLFHSMRQITQSLTVKHVSSANFLPKPATSAAEQQQWSERLSSELARAVGVKVAHVSPQTKRTFLDFFNTGIKPKL